MHGIEIDAAMLDVLRKKRGGGRVTMYVGDMADLAVDASFDARSPSSREDR